MKSSTLHRSNLSKERIAVLEELISDRRRPTSASPGVYMRSNKDKDLDLLWQGLKPSAQKMPMPTRSSASLISIGFVIGAICTFLLTSIFYSTDRNDVDYTAWKKTDSAPIALNVTPADDVVAPKAAATTRSYTIKSGDTLDSISLKFYGNTSNVKKIQAANKLESPHKISIGQKLIIPVE